MSFLRVLLPRDRLAEIVVHLPGIVVKGEGRSAASWLGMHPTTLLLFGRRRLTESCAAVVEAEGGGAARRLRTCATLEGLHFHG